MARVFFTSDLHFGHTNLCLGLRQMSPVESDRLIIENWNKVVTKRDIVYVLGDITMENHKNVSKYLSQLNGTIIIVGGNHDTKKCCEVYKQLGITVMGVLKYKGYICTHIPIHPGELVIDGIQQWRGNIHGHVHQLEKGKAKYDYGPLYYNVNTELHNYTPIAFDNLVKDFQQRQLIEDSLDL